MRARRRLYLGVAAAVMLWSALSTTAAVAAPVDAASSRVVLGALQRYLTGLLADAPASREGDDAFVASTAASCPNVLAAVNLLPSASVSSAAATALGEEVGADLALVSFVPVERTLLAALTNTIGRLRWSMSGSATTVRRSLDAERTYLELPPSDLCADADAFAAANAQTTPPETLQFLATLGRARSAAGLAGLLKTIDRFKTAADRRLITAVKSADKRVIAAGKALVAVEAPKLLSTLGASS